ncbi:MAG: ATP-binding protein [Pseudomonadota bacterium]
MNDLIQLADLAPFGLLQLDGRRRIVAANPAAQSIFGHSERTMLRRPLSEVIFHDSMLFDLIDRSKSLEGDLTAHAVVISGPGFSRSPVLDIRIRPIEHDGVVISLVDSNDPDVVDSPASVSAFARILGHEVKNPLAGISGAAQLLMRQARDDQTGMLDIILSETQRIERLVSRLSAFELFSSPRMSEINIHVLLDKVIAAEGAAHGDKVRFERHYDPSLPEIDADEDHLHEAFLNITRNAAEAALTHRNVATVKMYTAFETGFAIAGLRMGERLGRALRITVEDNGPGISPENREKLFELFTSSKSGGRGLGLNVVSEIVNAHRGRIKIDSKPGQTRFSVYLPMKRKT